MVLDVQGLSKQYSKVLAADQVSFQIGEGEIFALIGPNGAGKTTTIRMIATLLQPTGGDHQHDHKLSGEQFPQLFFQQTNELHAAAPPFQILPPDLPHHTGSSAPPAFR